MCTRRYGRMVVCGRARLRRTDTSASGLADVLPGSTQPTPRSPTLWRTGLRVFMSQAITAALLHRARTARAIRRGAMLECVTSF